MRTILRAFLQRGPAGEAFRPIVTAALMALAATLLLPAHANRYTVIDLGKQRVPQQVNDAGQVAGFTARTKRAIEYRDGRWRRLPDGADQGFALAIDRHGDVAGVQSGAAVVWERYGRLTGLPVPDGSQYSQATGLTDDLVATGYYYLELDVSPRCFISQPAGTAQDLGTPGNGDMCMALGINGQSQVAGVADIEPGGPNRAFLWQAGAFVDLGTLKGGYDARAFALNDRGEVVGDSTTGTGGQFHAFLYTGGRMRDIGGSTQFADSRALAINDGRADQVEIVGLAFTAQGENSRAARFDVQLGPIDLNDEVADRRDWQLISAQSVNDDGVIVGQGQRSDGPHAFMLVPQAQAQR
jgi:probable HAF family extracellular repeat protein